MSKCLSNVCLSQGNKEEIEVILWISAPKYIIFLRHYDQTFEKNKQKTSIRKFDVNFTLC